MSALKLDRGQDRCLYRVFMKEVVFFLWRFVVNFEVVGSLERGLRFDYKVGSDGQLQESVWKELLVCMIKYLELNEKLFKIQ